MRLFRTFWPEAVVALVGLLLLAAVSLGQVEGYYRWREAPDGNAYLFLDGEEKGVWNRTWEYYRSYDGTKGWPWGDPQEKPPKEAPPIPKPRPNDRR